MLIESLHKRPAAPIEMRDGTVYYFKPLDGNPLSPHVCEVLNDDHIDRLIIGIPEGYRRARPYALPPPIERVASDSPPVPVSNDITDEQRERVTALVASTVPDIRSAVMAIVDVPLLRAFLAAEQADKQRATVVQAINNRISALPPVEVVPAA